MNGTGLDSSRASSQTNDSGSDNLLLDIDAFSDLIPESVSGVLSQIFVYIGGSSNRVYTFYGSPSTESSPV
jgi:hypothetical protein